MTQPFTLWTDEQKKHYYRLPAAKQLPPGNFVIRSLNGREQQTVDPLFLATYLLNEEEAKEAVQAEMGQLWEQARPVLNNFLGLLAQESQKRASQKVTPAVDPSPNIVTDLLGATPAEIQDDPELLKAKVGEWINSLQTFLHNATAVDTKSQEAARAQMRNLRALFEANGWSTTDEMEKVPDKLREHYNSPERQSNEARLANALRELAAQVVQTGVQIGETLKAEADKVHNVPPPEKNIEA